MVQIVSPVVAWHTVKNCVIVHILGPQTGSEMDSRADIDFFCHLNPGNVVAKFKLWWKKLVRVNGVPLLANILLNFNFKLKRFSGERIWSTSPYPEFLGACRSLPQILSSAQFYCENAVK